MSAPRTVRFDSSPMQKLFHEILRFHTPRGASGNGAASA